MCFSFCDSYSCFLRFYVRFYRLDFSNLFFNYYYYIYLARYYIFNTHVSSIISEIYLNKIHSDYSILTKDLLAIKKRITIFEINCTMTTEIKFFFCLIVLQKYISLKFSTSVWFSSFCRQVVIGIENWPLSNIFRRFLLTMSIKTKNHKNCSCQSH